MSPSCCDGLCVFLYHVYTKPQGRNIIQVCQTLSCSLNGADELVDHVTDKYKIKPGETTADDRFTLMKVECLGLVELRRLYK
ncbi:MAG: hypothetical protein Ct9H300mP29_4970 [Candidatus Neomarinimicrobiota bacterium]|nr:MAG: hypothetical protein Ct9H300mP29_4970 [Candidatus Neomarinimicrobiota bacterium]